MSDTAKEIALCQFRGMLIYMEIAKADDGLVHCPECDGIEFRELHGGWVRCDGCGEFAMLRDPIEPGKEH